MIVYLAIPPLTAAISLVYAASRHESWPAIWRHAGRLFATILGIMTLATAGLVAINWALG